MGRGSGEEGTENFQAIGFHWSWRCAMSSVAVVVGGQIDAVWKVLLAQQRGRNFFSKFGARC